MVDTGVTQWAFSAAFLRPQCATELALRSDDALTSAAGRVQAWDPACRVLVRVFGIETPVDDREQLASQFGDSDHDQRAFHRGTPPGGWWTTGRSRGPRYHAGRGRRVCRRLAGGSPARRRLARSEGGVEFGTTVLDQLVVAAVAEPGAPIAAVLEWLADRPFGVSYCEHEPAHIDTLERTGFTATTAVTDIDEGIAAVRKRLESDGNLEVSANLRRKKRIVY